MLDDDIFDSADGESRSSRRRSRPRWGRRILVTLLCLLLLLGAGAGGFAVLVNSKFNNDLKRDSKFLPGQDSAAASQVTGGKNKGKKLVTGEGQNYLLVGADQRPGDHGRADVIQLVHIDKKNSKVYLIHFPRDLYVDIPGRGKDKINAAYAYGNMPLLIETIQNLVGVKIDHVALTNFEGFKGMVDAVGGIRVYAEEGSTTKGNGGQNIKQGWNDLNGSEALGFVRERYQLSQGDISRGRRQQAFLKALLLKTLDPAVLLNPVKLTKFIDAGLKYSTVDDKLTTKEMRAQALRMRNIRGGDVVFVTAPYDGFGTSPQGASIDILDEQGMAELGDALQGDDMPRFIQRG